MGSHKARVGKLPTPVLVISNITSGSAVLTWSLPRAYPYVSQYIVERGSDGISFPTTVYTGANLTCNDVLTHQSGVVRYYRIRFLSTLGSYSDYSALNSFVVYAPVISISAPSSLTFSSSGGTYNWAQWVSDADSNEVLTYSLPSKYRSDITIDQNTGIMSVPGTAAGTSGNITVRVTDKYNLTVEKICGITVQAIVNQAPVWLTLPTLNQAAGTTINLAPYATDPNGDTLTFSMVSQTGGHSISPAGVFTFGTSSGSVVMRATDPGGLYANTASTTVTVQTVTSDTTPYVDPIANVTRVQQKIIYAAPTTLGTGSGTTPANAMTLLNALAAATNGTTIQLAGGTYSGSVAVNRTFTAANALLIKGAPLWASIATGAWTMTGAQQIVTGILFSGSSATMYIQGVNNHVIGNKFTGWQTSRAISAGITGDHAEVAYNEIFSPGAWIGTDPNGQQERFGFRTMDNAGSASDPGQYFHENGWIHHNYIHDFPDRPTTSYSSGQCNAIEIGETATSYYPAINAGWYVEYNLIRNHLEGQVATAGACLDIKTGGNVIRYNSFDNVYGRLDVRGGSIYGNTIESNWFANNCPRGGGTYHGDYNKIVGNRYPSTIYIMAGNLPSDTVPQPSNQYPASYNATVAGNIATVIVGYYWSGQTPTYPANLTTVRQNTGSVTVRPNPAVAGGWATNTDSQPTVATTINFKPAAALSISDVGPDAIVNATTAYKVARGL